jgi:hypothetical protein
MIKLNNPLEDSAELHAKFMLSKKLKMSIPPIKRRF